jgi:hypothetical protein
MDPSLKSWAQQGCLVDLCLALQTAKIFADLESSTGLTKQALQARLPRDLRQYKGTFRRFLDALDGFALHHGIETWTAWGAFMQVREMPPFSGEAGLATVAARWDLPVKVAALLFLEALAAVEPSVRVELRKGEYYLTFLPPPPLGPLTIRYGRVAPETLVPLVLQFINAYSLPVDASQQRPI